MSDIGPNDINLDQVRKLYDDVNKKIQENKSTGETGFQEVLKGFMTEVNDLQLKANDKIEKLATGEITDLNEVLVAATEAETSFKIMMDIRNRLMAAYKEVSKMGGG